MILVSGATGHLGASIIAQLRKHAPAGSFAALARNPDKAAALSAAGIEVRQGDYDHPHTLSGAFAGVRTLMFISSMSLERTAQQAAVVDAAVRAGVDHIVYTGLAIADIQRSATQAVMASHFQTEQHIIESGVGYTFLRNTMYAEALPAILGSPAVPHTIALNAGTGRVPFALRRELGEAAANVLLQPGHRGKTYHLTGAHALSFADVAAELSHISGHAVRYTPIDANTLRAGLTQAGLPGFMVDLTVGTLDDIQQGQYEIASTDLATLLGRKPASPHAVLNEVFDSAANTP